VKRRFLGLQGPVDQADRLRQVVDPASAGVQLADIRRVHRQGDGPRHHAVEVEADGRDRPYAIGRGLAVAVLAMAVPGLRRGVVVSGAVIRLGGLVVLVGAAVGFV